MMKKERDHGEQMEQGVSGRNRNASKSAGDLGTSDDGRNVAASQP